MYPSFLAMCLTGFILLFIIIFVIIKMSNNELELSSYQKIIILLGFAIVIAIHGLAHAYAEVNFGFNPLEGKFSYNLTH
jgi:disulfide bond formation protein DsbB